MRCPHSKTHITLHSCSHARSRGKPKLLFLHCHNAYDHQVWEVSDLTWGASHPQSHITLQSCDLARSLDKLKLLYISTTTVPITTKLGQMAIFHDGFSPIRSRDPLITWSCDIIDTKIVRVTI